jgi:NADP-dependent 3-hydroxy acid dehydrogenase YdfG
VAGSSRGRAVPYSRRHRRRFRAGPCHRRGPGRRRGSVALLGRTRTALEGAAAAGDSILVLPTDVTDERQVDEAFAAVRDAWGRLDLLVNNAGTFGPSGEIDEIAVVDWRATVESTSPGCSSAPAPPSG